MSNAQCNYSVHFNAVNYQICNLLKHNDYISSSMTHNYQKITYIDIYI